MGTPATHSFACLADKIMHAVTIELNIAQAKFPRFNSPHEGYAVLLEEVNELWDAIKDKNASRDAVRDEAIQVAAMAIRFIIDTEPRQANPK